MTPPVADVGYSFPLYPAQQRVRHRAEADMPDRFSPDDTAASVDGGISHMKTKHEKKDLEMQKDRMTYKLRNRFIATFRLLMKGMMGIGQVSVSCFSINEMCSQLNVLINVKKENNIIIKTHERSPLFDFLGVVLKKRKKLIVEHLRFFLGPKMRNFWNTFCIRFRRHPRSSGWSGGPLKELCKVEL